MADANDLRPLFHTKPDLASQAVQPASWRESFGRDVRAIIDLLRSGGGAEGVAKVAAKLPLNDPLGRFFTKLMVNTLWSSLLHPPLSYKGTAFQFRSPDGSNNSVLFPKLGQAGLPYAKTVQASAATHGAKPDPGDLFDMLMARDEHKLVKESDLGIASMLLYHADIIIHDIFRTNRDDRNISDTSSYLDLSPLYGKDRAAQENVRTMKDGLLKPDSFAEDRLLNQPPGVCIYLIMYNRFHNYVARQLKAINENGKFSPIPKPKGDEWKNWEAPDEVKKLVAFENALAEAETTTDKQMQAVYATVQERNNKIDNDNKTALNDPRHKGPFKEKRFVKPHVVLARPEKIDPNNKDQMWKRYVQIKQDEDLFQTARLITCGLYINISIHDYLRCLMRQHAQFTSWTLDPRLEMDIFNKDTIQRGIGNQVTVEFNVLYRFHSPLSKRDANWTKRFLQGTIQAMDLKVGPGKDCDLSDDQFDTGDLPLMSMQKVLYWLNTENTSVETKYLQATPRYLRVDKDHEDLPNDIPEAADPFSFILSRDETGKFNDKDLVSEMVRVVQDPICQFGAQNVPKFFRTIEILGILQSRKWEMATLNEFREFFKLSRHKTFEDINADPAISGSLRNLYGHPDMVELYPGLFCEGDGRCLDPGTSGPNGSGTALWRGVFSDAVTLVRSDRFYTIDWNTDSLTAWGMKEVTPDPGKTFKGSVMHRLFQRAFPGYFQSNSIHLWQPFYTPAMNSILAHDQNVLPDLEDLTVEKLGISKEEFIQIEKLKNESSLLHGKIGTFPRTRDGKIMDTRVKGAIEERLIKSNYHLSADDLEDIESVHTKINNNFYKLPLYKRLLASRQGDWAALNQKIRFKILKDRLKLKIVERSSPPLPVSDPITLRDEFLNPEKIQLYKNPGFADKSALPKDRFGNLLPIGELLAQEGDLYLKGQRVMQKLVSPKQQELFFDYFVDMARVIRERQELDYTNYYLGQLNRAKQIDILQDLAIPVVTRFVADLLGFGHLIKTERKPKRPYDESQIYAHFSNCQDYLTFESDETKAFPRRQAFQASLEFLRNMVEKSVAEAQPWWCEFLRTNHMTADDSEHVRNIRAFGVKAAQTLTKELGSQQKAAAMMLAIALDSIHKSVVMFSEVMQCLLCTFEETTTKEKIRPHWVAIQKELKAKKGTREANDTIIKYVLEAQRINLNIPLVRQYKPEVGIADPTLQLVRPANPDQDIHNSTSPTQANGRANGSAKTADSVIATRSTRANPNANGQDSSLHTLGADELFLLEVRKAMNDSEYFPNPEKVDVHRDLSQGQRYLIYHPTEPYHFNAKQLTIYAVAGMVKDLASLSELREAHDAMGQVKTAEVPAQNRGAEDDYRQRFLTIKWDELGAFPTTWNLRYTPDGELRAAPGIDNSQQGHNIGQLVGPDTESAKNKFGGEY